jgi:hypothetical protein
MVFQESSNAGMVMREILPTKKKKLQSFPVMLD